MTILFGDIETYSEANLKTAGTHQYSDPDAHPEVMLFLYAVDDGPVMVWDVAAGLPMPAALANPLWDNKVELVFQNSHFDRTLLRKALGITLKQDRFHDTMIQAMVHSLPGGLEKMGYAIGLPEDKQKSKRGYELIRLFCMPRPKNHKLRRATRDTHPAEWQEFINYGMQDVVAMREAHHKMPMWNYKRGSSERRLWNLDQKINDRGVAIDLDLARAAIVASNQAKAALRDKIQTETAGEVSSATKRDLLLAYILAEHGVDLPDMTSDTLKRRMDDPELPDAVRQLLAIRLEATMVSSAKYLALVNATSPDGRLRNTLQFAGALRTQRWAGRLFQPQNMKRPDPDFKKEATLNLYIDAIKAGMLDTVHDEPMRVLANVVRGCIVAPPGKKFCIADLSNIEGRMLVWLAGEEWKLKAFHDIDKGIGEDMYKQAYGASFSVDPASVDDYQRQIGKVQELMLGYGGGVGAFITGAATYKIDLDELAEAVWLAADRDALKQAQGFYKWAMKKRLSNYGLEQHVYVACELLKEKWREAHPAVVALWKSAGDAVTQAIRNKGVAFPIGPWLMAQCDGAWLRVRLPSGRYLCYLHPQVTDKGEISYMGISQYTRQWIRIRTYGGKLCIAKGTPVLTKRGWVKIEEITAIDEVWDGVEWVANGGAVRQGVKPTITAYGARMTADHLVLSKKGWIHALQSDRHNRAACRLPDGVRVPQQRWDEVIVECGLRLRQDSGAGSERIEETTPARNNGLMRLQAQGNHRTQEHNAWNERPPGVRGVAGDGRSVPVAYTPGLAQLWRAGNRGLRAVAAVIRQFLVGYGTDLFSRVDARAQAKQRQLHTGELRMGNLQDAGKQPTREYLDGRRTDDGSACRQTWGQTLNDAVPCEGGGTAGAVGRASPVFAEVYDLINCGPRARFVIAAGGEPLIVHNCENFDQAVSRDVLAWDMPAIDESGYPIVLTVHDEIIAETEDMDEFSSDTLAAMMARPKSWAPGLPLAAKGFETYRYRKD